MNDPSKKIGVCFLFGYRLESRAAIYQVLLIQQKKQRRISLLLNTSHQRGILVVYRSLLQTSGYTTFFCKPYIQLSHSKTKQYTYWLFPLYFMYNWCQAFQKKLPHCCSLYRRPGQFGGGVKSAKLHNRVWARRCWAVGTKLKSHLGVYLTISQVRQSCPF